MNRTNLLILAGFFTLCTTVSAGVTTTTETPKTDDEETNSRDLFSLETNYTFSGDFQQSEFGEGTSLYNDFSYDHRFLLKGNWYFRTGVEYERYDFGGTANGLPGHLQAIYGHLAIEYVLHDRAGF